MPLDFNEGTAAQMEHDVLPAEQTTPAKQGQSAPEPIRYERFLDCVHCGLCTAACPTYLETGNENASPRGRIYLMRAVTDGRIELSATVAQHLDSCLDCRSCESACPSGVQYGRLIEPFRTTKQDHRPTGWTERFVMGRLFPYRDRLRRALAPARWAQRLGLMKLASATGLIDVLPQPVPRMTRLLPALPAPSPPLPEFLPAIGERRARVGLLLGCVADAMFRQTHWATARVLQQNGCEVVVPRTQVCCGAIDYHGGNAAPALRAAERNAQVFEEAGIDALVINVAGCGSMVKDYPEIARELAPEEEDLHRRLGRLSRMTRDISEFLVELGPVAPANPIPMRATYHDACHLAHAQQVRSAPRQLLELIPGLTLLPLAESEICCGAAGSYNLTQPEMAERLGRRKVEHILATGAEAVVTGNAGCSLQIQMMLREAGRPLPVWHPMDLLDRAYQANPATAGAGATA